MTAEQAMESERPHWLLREQNQLPAFPIVGADAEIGGLAPERRAVGKSQVYIERVVAIGTAGHINGLAPTTDNQRRRIGAVKNNGLTGSKPAAARRVLAR